MGRPSTGGSGIAVRSRRAQRIALVGLGAAALAAASAAPAQALRPIPPYAADALDAPTPQTRGEFGWDTSTVGDIDHDGVADIGVGAVGQNFLDFSGVGRAWVFSGRTRRELLVLNHPAPQSDVTFAFGPFGNFGSSIVGIGDVDGDATPDIAVGAFREKVFAGVDNAGAPNAAPCFPPAPEPNGCTEFQGRVYVFSGRNGSLLYRVDDPHPGFATFGEKGALSVTDIDGDGVRDFVEIASFQTVGGHDFGGTAYAFSGRDGRRLYEFSSPLVPGDAAFDFATFGQGTSNPGDVNGDGVDDPVIGAAGFNNGQGRAYLFNGRDGALLRTLASPIDAVDGDAGFGLEHSDGGGTLPGDVNGDGVRDIYVAAPGADAGEIANAGRAFLISGADGSVIRALDDPRPEAAGSFGYAVASAGDVNGDGTPDLVVARHVFGTVPGAAAYIMDPRTGAVLATLPGMQADGPGDSLASPGDLNADGYPDYVFGGADTTVGTTARQGREIVVLSRAEPVAPAAPAPGPAPVGRDVLAPVLRALMLAPRAFRASRSGGATSASVGSRVSFTLSEPASLRFRIERASPGRRAGGRCVPATPADRAAARCTRYATLPGGFSRPATGGANRFRLTGRLAGRTLARGRYRLVAVARDDAGNTSTPARASFRILASART